MAVSSEVWTKMKMAKTDDVRDTVEIVTDQKVSHFRSVNRFMELMKELMTDDIKYIQIF